MCSYSAAAHHAIQSSTCISCARTGQNPPAVPLPACVAAVLHTASSSTPSRELCTAARRTMSCLELANTRARTLLLSPVAAAGVRNVATTAFFCCIMLHPGSPALPALACTDMLLHSVFGAPELLPGVVEAASSPLCRGCAWAGVIPPLSDCDCDCDCEDRLLLYTCESINCAAVSCCDVASNTLPDVCT